MELIPLVCPKCGAPLTEGKTTKCPYCGTTFIKSEAKATPRPIYKPKQFNYSGSPSATASEGPTLSRSEEGSYSYSTSVSPSPSPSEPPPTAEDYLRWKILSVKFKKFGDSIRK